MAPASDEPPPPLFSPSPAPDPAPPAPPPIAASSSTSSSSTAIAASSKRRWSPSTWRYAIEEGQPELGSRPRSSHSQLPYSSSSSSSAAAAAAVPSTRKADYESLRIHKKPHLNHHHQHHHHPQLQQQQQQQQQPQQVVPVQNHLHHQPKDAALKKRPKLEEGADDGGEKDEGDRGRSRLLHPDDVGLEEQAETDEECSAGRGERAECGYGNEASKRRRRQKREMSPSELYFCELCSTRRARGAAAAAASGLKLNRSRRSPSNAAAIPDS